MLKSIAIVGLLYAQGTFAGCNSNNCFNAVKKNADQASIFCPQYLSTTGMAIPDYLSNCKDDVAKVSSACSCFNPGPTVAPTPTCAAGCASTVTDTVTVTTPGVTVTITSVAPPVTTTASCAPACPVPATALCELTSVQPQSNEYDVFFTGTCVTTIDGSANAVYSFAGNLVDNECTAMSSCARRVEDNGYLAYNMIYKIAEDMWECRAYNSPLASTDITTPNSNVGHSYGLNIYNP